MEDERSERDDDKAERPAVADTQDPDNVIPADKTAPGVGEVEIGGESLDP
ncbi:MAG: hypothetical protein M3P40_10970 [Actinomycetota bacterium]|nr:hypothetical protein [Actinomycetota bacterium]